MASWAGVKQKTVRDDLVDIPTQQLRAAYTQTYLEHCAGLDIKSEPARQRLSGIICTIGPASREVDVLMSMYEAGMGVARVNLSHGDQVFHTETVNNIRKAVQMYSQKIGFVYPLAIAVDTSGPEIRIGLMKNNVEVDLEPGAKFFLSTDEQYKECGTKDGVFCTYNKLSKVVKPGDRIFIDEGLISIVVDDINGGTVLGTVEAGGKLGSNKGCNLPGIPVDLPNISDKDADDLRWAADIGVDMVFASFVRDGATVDEMRKMMGEKGKGCLMIPKIACQQALDNIDDIIAASDGILISRGELGIEISPWKVFLVQKSLFAKCNIVGKPCICATQMLESMTHHPRPTRAEANDVATAILDGADSTMLSGESATGEYPAECVTVMARIALEAESAVWQKQYFLELCYAIRPPLDPAHAIAIACVDAAMKACASAIIVCTTSGRSARLISRYRPRCPIIAVSRHGKVARQNMIYRAITSLQYVAPPMEDWLKDVDMRIQFAIAYGKMKGFIAKGDALLLVSGWRGGAGFTNTLRIVYASGD